MDVCVLQTQADGDPYDKWATVKIGTLEAVYRRLAVIRGLQHGFQNVEEGYL